MAVSITTILGTDAVSSSRLTINSNFSALKSAIDAVTELLNPTTYAISGIKSAVIDDAAMNYANTIFQVGKGSALLGNVILGTTGASTTVLLNGTGGFTIVDATLNMTNGNLNLNSTSSVLTLAGHLSVSKEARYPGISTAFSSMISLTSTSTYSISPSGLKYIIVKNGSTASFSVNGLTASLASGVTGQKIEIYHSKGPSGPFKLQTTNFTGVTGSIVMRETGDKITCVWEASSWYLWDYTPAYNYGATAGATGTSSITFTRT
jgi:hypothetical protein